eukprot:306398-Chlamydomonas_euryale.AAC.1
MPRPISSPSAPPPLTGGALYVNELQRAPVMLERVRFVENEAFAAGALFVLQSNTSISECVFDRNLGNESVGAFSWAQPITSSEEFQINISASNFTRNRAAGYLGGALRIQKASSWPADDGEGEGPRLMCCVLLLKSVLCAAWMDRCMHAWMDA